MQYDNGDPTFIDVKLDELGEVAGLEDNAPFQAGKTKNTSRNTVRIFYFSSLGNM
jgi:hypothetical protein